MKIIISAGGTGGHIYPALAIINKFKEKEKNLEVLYIGTHNRMESEIIPKKNINYVPLTIYGFSKSISLDIKNIPLIIKAYKKCLEVMKEFKPDVVIGVGGYVTYPVIKAAHKLGIKTFIHEQNAIVGKSNKMLAKYADIIGVSFEESKNFFKNKNVIVCGNPCGENALSVVACKKEEYNLSSTLKTVLIVSGSLGSSSLNPKIKDYIKNIKEEKYQVLLVTGKNYFNYFNDNVEKYSKNVHIFSYIDDLSRVMKISDLIITRAGASTISEILSLSIPAIYIPSPNVANNHQYYNALSIKNNNAGDLLEEKNITTSLLKEKVNNILNDKEVYLNMKNNAKKMSVNNSSSKIYYSIKDMIKNDK